MNTAQTKQRASSHSKGKKKTSKNETQPEQKDDYLTINESHESQRSSNFERTSVVLGVCAMKKKVQSKPMKEILHRLKCQQLQILEMWQFLDKPWTLWPKVDALICFHSDGFPYLNAWKYVKKHRPFLINNLEKQQLLWDRTVVYDILRRIKVPIAKHFMVFRDLNYLDDLEKRGFGKTYLDEGGFLPSFTDVQIITAQQLEKKASIASNSVKSEQNSPKSNPSLSILISTKSKSNLSHQQRGSGKQERPQTTHEIKKPSQSDDEIPIQKQQETLKPEQLKVKKEDSSKIYKSKHKFSQANIFDPVKSAPNTLRAFHQKRLKEIKVFEVEQIEDHIIFRCGDQTHRLNKPFVEKPFDSQNHQICVYYPQSMGGGRKMLFRKVQNSSSTYQNQQNQIRRDGNYIYEQFLPTNAFDIKVYTIGPFYMYAEARRSPTLDGVVQRNSEGKQVRFPVILTPDEKFICHRIVKEFQQEVCGFDLLRANGKSYVCDVNGWSFVKANPKYWDDCSILLKTQIFSKFFPDKKVSAAKNMEKNYERFSKNLENAFRPPMDTLCMKRQELRSIVSLFRHGDRSPKLKMKIQTSDSRFIEFFHNSNLSQLKLKDQKNLTKILTITNSIIANTEDLTSSTFKDFSQMKAVLESGGHFEGFTRKLQLKVLERAKCEATGKQHIKSIQIVLKWGGELSWFGYQDSIELGKKIRTERYDDANDCLSLYSSYKHDLKTYSSDEGRCIKTAAAFLKGFLNIEGELAPIITSMVTFDKKAQSNTDASLGLLDCTSEQNHSILSDSIKQKLSQVLNSDEPLMTGYLRYANPHELSDQMKKLIEYIGRPLPKLNELHNTIKKLVYQIKAIQQHKWQQQSFSERVSCHQVLNDTQYDHFNHRKCQDIILIYKRWHKLQKDFYDETSQKYNISKIPEIYDTIRHDLRKNQIIFKLIEETTKQTLKTDAKQLAYFVMPNEYGITEQQRVQTAKNIALPLLQKILVDLMFWRQKDPQEQKYWKYKNNDDDNWRHIRTRLYFTSASHVYSILNIITLGNSQQLLRISQAQESQKIKGLLYMGYLSHIEFRLYENLMNAQNDPNRFRLELSISSQYDKSKQMKQFSMGGHGFTINKIKQFIESFTNQKKRSSSENKEYFRNIC